MLSMAFLVAETGVEMAVAMGAVVDVVVVVDEEVVVVVDVDPYLSNSALQHTNKFALTNLSRAASLYQDRNAQPHPSNSVAQCQNNNVALFLEK